LMLLLASTLATGNPLYWGDLELIKEIRLDMAPNSFDDQYLGCSHMMEKELKKLNWTESSKNSVFAKYWTKATAEWQKKWNHVHKPLVLRTEQAVAIMAYTLPGPLYQTFNAAVREAGRSRREYLDKFHFKVLHFLLTQALRNLWNSQTRGCHHVYRGVKDIRFTARRKDAVRFGQFTSTSLQKEVAIKFGWDTFFSVYTCYGVPIKYFSYFPNENEVLIPPYERFEVTTIVHQGKRTYISLQSRGTWSKYNCEWFKGKRCQEKPCNINTGRSIVEDPPRLRNLLLEDTALAATGGP
ncbi:NARE ribosyltransferase, partial [Jacana jacana]|nr:NARE ribosyltransferase [Jacana jacana]